MNRFLVCKMRFAVLLFFAVPVSVNAQAQDKQEVQKKQDDKKQDPKKTVKEKTDEVKPEIKEVPRARKQQRPSIVLKPNVKVKPIKIIRPKIKRP